MDSFDLFLLQQRDRIRRGLYDASEKHPGTKRATTETAEDFSRQGFQIEDEDGQQVQRSPEENS